jgi:hypothetical protein
VRTPPPVSVVAHPDPAWRAFCVFVPALTVCAVVAWFLAHWQLPGALALLGLPVLVAVLWRIEPANGCHLVWEGQVWTADGVPGRLEVVFDLGPWMLLRLRPEVPAPTERWRWVPVAMGEVGADFHALRAAAYGGAPEKPPDPLAARSGTAAGAD